MAKQVQDPASAQLGSPTSDFPDVTMPSPQTKRIMPVNIDPPRMDTSSPLAAAVTGVAQLGAQLVNRHSKMEALEAQQQHKEAVTQATLQARAGGLQQIEAVLNQQPTGLDFNPDVAGAAGRAVIVDLVSGESGRWLDNDTIRMFRSHLNKTIEDLTPKTTVRTDKFGVTTVIQEGAGGISSEVFVNDLTETNTRKVAWVMRNHPTVMMNIQEQVESGAITQDQGDTRIDNIINMESRISMGEKRNQLSEVANVANQIPEVERKISAKMEAYGVLDTHINIAKEVLMDENFNREQPGNLTQVAMQLLASVPQTFNTDEAFANIGRKWGVDPGSEFMPQYQAYIQAHADLLIAQDPLTKAKLGAEGQVALATASHNKLQNMISEFRFQQGIEFNVVAQFGTNLGMLAVVQDLVADQGKASIQGDHLVKSLAVSQSTFANMAGAISELPDDDDPKTASKASDILTQFAVQADHWSNRNYMASADIIGFVNTMSMMKEAGTFERLAPDEWADLEEVFIQISNMPEHAELFRLIQEGDTQGLNQKKMDAYFNLTQRPVKQAAEPASAERKWWWE